MTAPGIEHAALVDPRTLAQTAIPPGPVDDMNPQMVWTGNAVVSLNAYGSESWRGGDVRPGDTAVWEPAARAWTKAARAPMPLSDVPAVWAGHELLALGRDGRLLLSFAPD